MSSWLSAFGGVLFIGHVQPVGNRSSGLSEATRGYNLNHMTGTKAFKLVLCEATYVI